MKILKHCKILTLTVLILVSCNFNKIYENRASDKEDAEKVSHRFYGFLSESNKIDAAKLFGKRFFEKFEKDNFFDILDKTDNEYGKIKNYELINSWTQIIEGTEPISKYELTYLVTRDSSQTTEHLKMQKENDSIKIIAYRIDFDDVPKK